MATQQNAPKGIFNLSSLIWLLIIVGALYLGMQLVGKKEAPTPQAGNASKTSASSATKNDASTKSMLQVPLGLYTPMQKSNDPYFMEGMKSYISKDYVSARKTWESLPKNSTVGPDTLNYYLGGTYFAQGDYPRAINHFQKTLARLGNKYGTEANWYLAVCNNELRNSYLAMEHIKKVDEHPLKDQLLHHLQSVIPEK